VESVRKEVRRTVSLRSVGSFEKVLGFSESEGQRGEGKT